MIQQSKYSIHPGTYLVIDKSGATGGVTYDRTTAEDTGEVVNHGDGEAKRFTTVKKVDHKSLVAESDQYVQSARYLLRCQAVNSDLGWIASADALGRIHNGWTDARDKAHSGADHLQAQAREFNRRAACSQSARRVSISIVAIKLEIDNAEAAEHIASTVRKVCEDFARELRAGNVDKLGPIFLRSKNLDQLGMGPTKATIEFALECARDARSELRKAKKAGNDLATAGAALDLESLEGCAAQFSDWDMSDLQEVA